MVSGIGRVALRTVVALITHQYRHLVAVVVRTSVVVEVIAGRVIERGEWIVLPLRQDAGVHFLTQGLYVVKIWTSGIAVAVGISELKLLLRTQTIETHVLLGTSAGIVGEGHRRRSGLGYDTPDRRVREVRRLVRHGNTVLETLLTVAQDILGYITEVDI